MVGIFLTLLHLFSLVDLGLSTTMNRELARMSANEESAEEMHDLVRTLEVIYWGLAILIGIAMVSVASLIANYWVNANTLSTSTIHWALILLGFVLAFQFPFSLYSGGLMGLQRQVLLNALIATMATLRAVGAVLVLWFVAPTIEMFFLWQLGVSVVQTLLAAVLLRAQLPRSQSVPQFNVNVLLRIWRFAAGMTGISVMAVILTQLDKVILSKVLTLEAFGYYSLAWMVASGLYYFVTPVFSALFPRFSQLATVDDSQALIQLYHRSCQLMSVILVPIAVIVALFSRELLLLWTGDTSLVDHTHLVLSLLIVGVCLNGLVHLPYALQLAYGRTKLPFYTNLVAVIILAPLIYAMAVRYGTIGAAAVWVVLNTGYVLIGLQLIHRRLLRGELGSWYRIDVGYPLAAVLLVAGLGRWFFEYPLSQT